MWETLKRGSKAYAYWRERCNREGNLIYQNIFITKWTREEEAIVYLWDDIIGLVVKPYAKNFGYAYKPSQHGKFRSMYGDRLSRIENARYDTPGLFESDINPAMRVLTDLYLDNDIPSINHRRLIFDIEVDSVGGFSTPDKAEKAITAIANHDGTTGCYTVFILDPDGYIQTELGELRRIISCKTEEGLLKAWLEYYEALAPTIISGWNSNGYDIPYTFNRLNRILGERAGYRLSPIEVVRYNDRDERYEIAGVSCLDYMDMYKKFTYIQQPSYRLDAIGLVELKIGKIEYEGTLNDLYLNDIETFIRYNLRDVELVVGLDKKMKLIELVRSICHTGHVPYEDYGKSSRFIEGAILTYLHRKNIVAPNRPSRPESLDLENGTFAGAYVKEPVPGIHEWVYSLDLQSLYPSIIMSLHISPETKAAVVKNWDVEKHLKKEILIYEVVENEQITEMTREQLVSLIATEKLTISSNGVLYQTNTAGIIPEILISWFDLRKEFKNKMKEFTTAGDTEQAEFYDRRQHVQKIFLNSVYGTLGLASFRFYDLDNALATTASGQDIIKTTAKAVNAYYNQRLCPTDPKDHVIYVDTDSVYVSAVMFQDDFEDYQDKKETTIRIAREVETHLNKFYDTLAKRLFNCDTHRLFIKGESVMSAGFWVAKKMYAMKKVYDLETNEDLPGKVKAKGLAVVRSQTPPAFKGLMTGMLEDILSIKDKAYIDKNILDFRETLETLPLNQIARNSAVKELSKFVEKGNISLSMFMKGTPAHVKAAMVYNNFLIELKKDKLHEPLRDGDKLKYLPLRENPYCIDRVAFKNYDDPPELLEYIRKYVDYDEAFNSEVAHKIQSFYDALGWGSIPTNINQNAASFFDFS